MTTFRYHTLQWDPFRQAYVDTTHGTILGTRYRNAAARLERLYHSAYLPSARNNSPAFPMPWETLGLAADLLACGYHINCVSRFLGISSNVITQRLTRWFPELVDSEHWSGRRPNNKTRNEAIEALIRQGWSDRAIAARMGALTYSTVAGIRFRMKERKRNVHRDSSHSA